jgi:hypothetical protein
MIVLRTLRCKLHVYVSGTNEGLMFLGIYQQYVAVSFYDAGFMSTPDLRADKTVIDALIQ